MFALPSHSGRPIWKYTLMRVDLDSLVTKRRQKHASTLAIFEYSEPSITRFKIGLRKCCRTLTALRLVFGQQQAQNIVEHALLFWEKRQWWGWKATNVEWRLYIVVEADDSEFLNRRPWHSCSKVYPVNSIIGPNAPRAHVDCDVWFKALVCQYLLHHGPQIYHNTLLGRRHYNEFWYLFRICGDGVQSLGQARRPQHAGDFVLRFCATGRFASCFWSWHITSLLRTDHNRRVRHFRCRTSLCPWSIWIADFWKAMARDEMVCRLYVVEWFWTKGPCRPWCRFLESSAAEHGLEVNEFWGIERYWGR